MIRGNGVKEKGGEGVGGAKERREAAVLMWMTRGRRGGAGVSVGREARGEWGRMGDEARRREIGGWNVGGTICA